MTTGLGLDGFMTYGEGGGSRKFLKDWKKSREIVVWLSTRSALAYPSFTHPFSTIATREAKDKDGNKTQEIQWKDGEVVSEKEFYGAG